MLPGPDDRVNRNTKKLDKMQETKMVHIFLVVKMHGWRPVIDRIQITQMYKYIFFFDNGIKLPASSRHLEESDQTYYNVYYTK